MNILQMLSGPAFLLILAGAGLYFTIRLKGIQFTRFPQIWKETFGRLFSDKKGDEKAISPFQATATALAGTLGTGNIAGVATALVGGGPGAIFWMWASSFFAMALKYAEIFLAVRFRTKNSRGEQVGGPMYYMEKGLESRWLAVLFSLLCVAASFGIGNLTQANAAAQAIAAAFPIPAWAVGLAMAVLVGLILMGGIRRIAAWTEKLIPVMALIYLSASVWVLVCGRENLLPCLKLMVSDAFHFQAVSGGVSGFLVSRAVRYGVARGVFSNEAGMGSAPIVHGAADTDSPVRQGYWGIVEVFLDTTVMCTVTALVILASGVFPGETDGSALTISAFRSVMGPLAGGFIAVSVFFFALASIIGWSYYGEKALEYLTAGHGALSCRAEKLYRFLFIFASGAGAAAPLGFIWSLSDCLNLLMALPNIVAVLLLSPVVIRGTNDRAS